VVYFNYPASGSTSVGDHFSRIDNIANDSAGTTQFGQYSYMGAGTILDVTHPQVANGLVYRQGPDSNPGGWDQFDRQIMTKWRNTANSFSHDLWNYTYDSISNHLTRQNAASTTAATPKDEFYSYDGLRRLTNLNRGKLTGSPLTIANTAANFQQNWPALETLGNWRTFNVAASGGGTFTLQQTRSHNAANEIDTNSNDADAPGDSIGATVGTNWMDPTYDKAGNMTTAPSPVPGSETTGYFYTYDAWNRLVKVQNGTRAAPGSEVVEFQYDAENWRTVKLAFVSTNVWNRTDYYFNLNWQCVEERTAASVSGKTTVATTPHYQWIWDLKYIDAVLLRDVVPINTSQRLYYCQDANQNTTALVNESTGSVVERYLFEAYGRVTVLDGSWNTQAGTVNNNEIIYAGYRKDPETQLSLARYRAYHPTLGRWMQRDPLNYAAGMNLYEYVSSNSVSLIDPWGLQDYTPQPLGPLGPTPMQIYKAWRKVMEWLSMPMPVGARPEGGTGCSCGCTGPCACPGCLEKGTLKPPPVVPLPKPPKGPELAVETAGGKAQPAKGGSGGEGGGGGGKGGGSKGGPGSPAPFGSKGVQTPSKTVWQCGKARLDVENPAPGKRPGQAHYQSGNEKYVWDNKTSTWQDYNDNMRVLSKTKQAELNSCADLMEALEKAITQYLGESFNAPK
jgi:RHS repeat-associated protein